MNIYLIIEFFLFCFLEGHWHSICLVLFALSVRCADSRVQPGVRCVRWPGGTGRVHLLLSDPGVPRVFGPRVRISLRSSRVWGLQGESQALAAVPLRLEDNVCTLALFTKTLNTEWAWSVEAEVFCISSLTHTVGPLKPQDTRIGLVWGHWGCFALISVSRGASVDCTH